MYMRVLNDKEIKQMNTDMVEWVKKSLSGEYGIYLYNILLQLKSLIEGVKHEHPTFEARQNR